MQTCPFSSHLPRKYQSALNCLSALSRPRKSFPCLQCSRYWEWASGVYGQHTLSLKSLVLTNSIPPSFYCLLLSSLPQLRHRCLPSAPLLNLSPPSVWWDSLGSASLHRRHGWRIPCVRLQPLSPGLHLGPLTQRLHHGSPPLRGGSSVHQLRQAPSSLRLCLGLSSTICCLGTPLLRLCLIPPSLWLCQAPPSLQLHLGPLSLRLHHCGLPDPRLGRRSHLLRLGPLDPQCHPGSSTLRLSLRLRLHLSAAVGQPPGVVSPSSTMASPSVGPNVGCHHGCGLGPAWLLLLHLPLVSILAPFSVYSSMVPPVSSVAPPSVRATLVICVPPCLPFSSPSPSS